MKTPETKRLKFFARSVTGAAGPNDLKLVLEDVASGAGRLAQQPAGTAEGEGISFVPGDVLFGKLRPYLAKAVAPDFQGSAVGEFLVLRPQRDSACTRFLLYLLLSQPLLEWSVATSYGAKMPRTSWEALGQFRPRVFDLETQAKIVEFLDAELAQVDALIDEKELLFQLVIEKRFALISALVTRGLDRSAPTKATPLPTIPAVPAHWDVVRNKVLMRERVELSTTGEEELLTVSHLTGVTPRSEKNVYMFLAESMVGYKICRRDDLVINTMWAWMGALGTASCDGIVSPAYGVYRFDQSRMMPEFYDLLYRTPAYRTEMTRYSKGVWTSRLRLYPESFLALTTVVPPMEEQRAIVDEIQRQVVPMDELSASLERSVALLKERRQALITSAVHDGLSAVRPVARDLKEAVA